MSIHTYVVFYYVDTRIQVLYFIAIKIPATRYFLVLSLWSIGVVKRPT